MNEVTKTIRRALKYGFDLSGLPNYTEKKFKSDLFDFLVRQKYYVTEESGIIMVGLDILDDTVEISIVNYTMKVKPLTDEGFFIIFVVGQLICWPLASVFGLEHLLSHVLSLAFVGLSVFGFIRAHEKKTLGIFP